jgi:hypothetical protein
MFQGMCWRPADTTKGDLRVDNIKIKNYVLEYGSTKIIYEAGLFMSDTYDNLA